MAKTKNIILLFSLLVSCSNKTPFVVTQSYNFYDNKLDDYYKIYNKVSFEKNNSDYSLINQLSFYPLESNSTYFFALEVNEKGTIKQLDDKLFKLELDTYYIDLQVKYRNHNEEIVDKKIEEFLTNLKEEKVKSIVDGFNDDLIKTASYCLYEFDVDDINKLINDENIQLDYLDSFLQTNYLYIDEEKEICKFLNVDK